MRPHANAASPGGSSTLTSAYPSVPEASTITTSPCASGGNSSQIQRRGRCSVHPDSWTSPVEATQRTDEGDGKAPAMGDERAGQPPAGHRIETFPRLVQRQHGWRRRPERHIEAETLAGSP